MIKIVFYIFSDNQLNSFNKRINFKLKINKDNISAEKIAVKYIASAIDLSFEIIKILINNNENFPKAIYLAINIPNLLNLV